MIFEQLSDHLEPQHPTDEDEEEDLWDVRHSALQLVADILPHLGPDTDTCLSLVFPAVVPYLGK